MRWHLKRRAARADARPVIELHRIHGNGIILVNADLIETVEATPDSVVTLVNKRRYVVEDTVAEIVDKVVAFRARIAAATGAETDHGAGARAAWIISDEEQAA
jgi:flagellar protein FlbD